MKHFWIQHPYGYCNVQPEKPEAEGSHAPRKAKGYVHAVDYKSYKRLKKRISELEDALRELKDKTIADGSLIIEDLLEGE